MTKLSKRLESLAKFVLKNDRVVDVGCDHGYLSIFLVENNLAKKVVASDINQNALNMAINNIKKRNLKIETVLSDGLNNIDMHDINTIIISGMGTATILHILANHEKMKNVNKLIIQSNNDHELLRKSISKMGYFLTDEKYIKDKDKWYITSLFIKSDKVNTKKELEWGLLNNVQYNKYLIDKEQNILKKIPLGHFKIKLSKYFKIRKLKKAISR